MSHPLLKTAIRLFYTSVLLLALAQIANACVCPVSPTVLDAFDFADTVMIVRVLSVEKVHEQTNRFGPPDNIVSATVKVERVYKGAVKVNEQLVFRFKAGCSWTYREEDINTDLLFYVNAPRGNEPWYASACGRSKPLSRATEDLLYLDKLKTVRGKTRVSGKYSADAESNQDLLVAHRSIRIVSDDKVFETNTDEKGFFEIYDLPPGEYRLEPEIPEGWRISKWGVRLASSTAARLISPKSILFSLQPKRHASVGLTFIPDNAVEGRIVGPNGNGLAKTCAYLRRPEEIANDRLGSTGRDCTDENGLFRIESVEPGTYLLVLNLSGIPRSHEPFPRVFYPGTTELEKATPITIGLGQTVKNINVMVPVLLETITLEGVVVFSDGQPAPKSTVRFDPIENPAISGFTAVDADEQGRFSIKILKGFPGTLASGKVIIRRLYPSCPEVDALIPTRDRTFLFEAELKIEAAQDLTNLVLRLPMPSCPSKPAN